MKQIINCETGEVTERNLNKEELAQAKIDAEMVLAVKALVEEKTEAKQAILSKLGLTEEEARLLLS